jgi:NADH-quinone oxidoreductase subunit L
MSWLITNLWLIPAVPLAISLVILSLARSRRKSAAALAIIGQAIALAFAIFMFFSTLQTPGFRAVQNFTWFSFGENALRIGWVLDPLAAAMLVMIALVGLCIFIFSVGYMADDKNFTRFFAYLSFFSGAMQSRSWSATPLRLTCLPAVQDVVR